MGIITNPITTTVAGKYGGPTLAEVKLGVQGWIEPRAPIAFYLDGERAEVSRDGVTWTDSVPFVSGVVTRLHLRVPWAGVLFPILVCRRGVTKMSEPIVTVMPDGNVTIGSGYSIGQVLEALEVARRAVLGVVLRPAVNETPESTGAIAKGATMDERGGGYEEPIPEPIPEPEQPPIYEEYDMADGKPFDESVMNNNLKGLLDSWKSDEENQAATRQSLQNQLNTMLLGWMNQEHTLVMRTADTERRAALPDARQCGNVGCVDLRRQDDGPGRDGGEDRRGVP